VSGHTTLAELLKQCRQQRGLSLREAAPAIGISHGQLCDIESGKQTNLTLATLRGAQLVYRISDRTLWAAAKETHIRGAA